MNLCAGQSSFRRPESRAALPYSISGICKADLFLGKTDSDRWVATSVKVNPNSLEGARGLRVGIVPASHTETDRPYMDERKNLIVGPLLHDGNFMQTFFEGWQVVQTFLAADAHLPGEVDLPRPPMREVARMLEDRRDFPVVDVVTALTALAQPELLMTQDNRLSLSLLGAKAQRCRACSPPRRPKSKRLARERRDPRSRSPQFDFHLRCSPANGLESMAFCKIPVRTQGRRES
jgi:hypothetical protein